MKLRLFTLFVLCTQTLFAQTIEVAFSKDILNEKFSGEIVLFLSKENPNPKDVFVGLELTPMFRMTVEDLQPGQLAIFDDGAVSYPVSLSNIERGEYNVQVVFDRNLGGQNIGSSPGNIYSLTQKVTLSKETTSVGALIADQVLEEYPFEETEIRKELKVHSQLLSDFHGKEMTVNAAVILPEDYAQNPDRKYPVVYYVFGFGANYRLYAPQKTGLLGQLDGDASIMVYLDGNCSEGHSVYANSDINGPWGNAFVDEFIPQFEKQYRTNGARFLNGHSSGGWTVLWMQIYYPKTFHGTWSSSPDQVDFRNYQGVNIYEDQNAFYDANNRLRYAVTMAGRIPVISFKDFARTEHVVYRGNQMRSFDAVFGGLDNAGNRIRLFDAQTGDINKDALSLWSRYDINKYLTTNWSDLKNDLSGKIKITVGNGDNFHLSQPVHMLEENMIKLGADINFEYFSGDHFTISREHGYRDGGHKFIEEKYKEWKAK